MLNNLSITSPTAPIVNRPKHIVFATDFSARCDRAQDRAIQLAVEWNASLTAVHALDNVGFAADPEAARSAIRKRAMRSADRLREELACVEGLRSTVLIGEGPPDAVILDVAMRERADLVITGIARTDGLSWWPGNTASSLAKSSPIPILVVKKKVVDTNASIVMATDLGPSSERAFRVALNWFSDQDHVLFHAYDPPYRMWANDKEAYGKDWERSAINRCRRFVADVGGEHTADRFDVLVRSGDVVEALSTVVNDADVDLVVAGTHSRTGILNVLVESVASRIMSEVESDALIVPLQ